MQSVFISFSGPGFRRFPQKPSRPSIILARALSDVLQVFAAPAGSAETVPRLVVANSTHHTSGFAREY